jgi:hypothetical protein
MGKSSMCRSNDSTTRCCISTWSLPTTLFASGDMRWRSWLMHWATNQKVAGSIPNGVIGIFHWHNRSGCPMTLGSTQPLNRNEYQKYFLGGNVGRCIGLTTLPPSCADCLKIWKPPPQNPQGLLRSVMGLLYLLPDHQLRASVYTEGY